MLKLTDICMQYQDSSKPVLKKINLEFPDNGLICILGPSGCGKTTLLNLIGLVDKPTQGEIELDDINLLKLKKREVDYYHHNIVGFIYQNYNLIDYLNVVDNIELINKEKHLLKLLDYLSLNLLRKKNVKKLSGGEKQRVAIARSLINDPRILLCDEPTGALDTKTSEKIMKLLKEVSKEKLVIVVTHNEMLANMYADRIITLQDGEVLNDTVKKKIKPLNNKIEIKKVKISYFKLLNIILKNIKYKYKRNILSVIAFSIGLISLATVLGISRGFNKAMEIEEKESLSKYPIIISETSSNLDDDIKNIFKNEEINNDDLIYAAKSVHKNKITKEYLLSINSLNDNMDYQINTYYKNNILFNTTNKKIEELNILKGSNLNKDTDVVLIVNNKKIDENILKSIGLKKKKYEYDEIINKTFKIKKKKYKIVGIASIDEDSYFNELSGILILNDNFQNLIPYSLSLYPKSYKDKQVILKTLNKYKNIYYTDYSSTIKKLSKTIVDAITVVLIFFSIISLVVSTIMIAIISYISVIERMKEIGIFKSMGLSNDNVKKVFMDENIVLGIISSMISILVCFLLSIGINNIFTKLTGLNNVFLIDLNLIFDIIYVSVILSIIGSSIPLRKLKKIKIIDCFKYE